MDQRQVQAFADLLERSLNCIAVRHDSRNEQMPLGTYRENLRRSWTVHDADLNLLITSRYRPVFRTPHCSKHCTKPSPRNWSPISMRAGSKPSPSR